jgi:hypothetical protein
MASASTPAWHGACIACCVGMRGAVDATVANPHVPGARKLSPFPDAGAARILRTVEAGPADGIWQAQRKPALGRQRARLPGTHRARAGVRLRAVPVARALPKDQHEILSGAQRRLPRIYLEHDPPLAHPTNTVHPVDDPDLLLVHVTHYNALMWDSGRVPTRVVEHGVRVPDGIAWSAAANHPGQRRRLRG